MKIRLYMDEHVPRAVTLGLRARGIDVLTAQEDEQSGSSDPDLLDRATALGRVLFSQDDDLLVEAKQRQTDGQNFAGVIYAHQLRIGIGQCIHDLEIVVGVVENAELMNQVIYLPL